MTELPDHDGPTCLGKMVSRHQPHTRPAAAARPAGSPRHTPRHAARGTLHASATPQPTSIGRAAQTARHLASLGPWGPVFMPHNAGQSVMGAPCDQQEGSKEGGGGGRGAVGTPCAAPPLASTPKILDFGAHTPCAAQTGGDKGNVDRERPRRHAEPPLRGGGWGSAYMPVRSSELPGAHTQAGLPLQPAHPAQPVQHAGPTTTQDGCS